MMRFALYSAQRLITITWFLALDLVWAAFGTLDQCLSHIRAPVNAHVIHFTTCTQINSLQPEQAEAAMQNHLAKQLPSILVPDSVGISVSSLKTLTLPGCIQLLAFCTWLEPAPAADSTQPSPRFIDDQTHLLIRLVSCIKAAQEEQQQQKQQQELHPSPTPLPFHVRLHLEPGGAAEYDSTSLSDATQPFILQPTRPSLHCCVDPPCLTAGQAHTVLVRLPTQGMAPEALCVLLVSAAAWMRVSLYLRP